MDRLSRIFDQNLIGVTERGTDRVTLLSFGRSA